MRPGRAGWRRPGRPMGRRGARARASRPAAWPRRLASDVPLTSSTSSSGASSAAPSASSSRDDALGDVVGGLAQVGERSALSGVAACDAVIRSGAVGAVHGGGEEQQPVVDARPSRRSARRSRPRGRRARDARPWSRPGSCAWLSAASASASARSSLPVAHLDRERALAGRGRPVREVEELGPRLEPAEAAEAGGGEHHGVEVDSSVTQREPGVDVAADVDDLEVGAAARAAGRRGAASRCRPGRPPAGSSRVRPSRAQSASRASARLGVAPMTRPGYGAGRQVLQRVHDDVALVGEQRLRAGRWRTRRCRRGSTSDSRRGVAVRGDRDDLDPACRRPPMRLATAVVWAMARALPRVPTRIDGVHGAHPGDAPA